MNKVFFGLAILMMPSVMHAQLGNVLNRAKNKIDNRVNNRIDKEIDRKLDEIEGKPAPSAGKQGDEASRDEPAATRGSSSLKSFSKFDFVPGERILYAEDFAQDAIGELPLSWNSSGKGEIMTLSNHPGNWLRVFQNNLVLSGNKKTFGENYTIEFDLMYFFDPKVKGYVLPGWHFGLFSSGSVEPSDNIFLKERSEINSTEVHIGYGSNLLGVLETKMKRSPTFKSDLMQIGDVAPTFNRMTHYSVQVQKTRFRFWIDEQKVFDIPRAINTADTMNQVFFKLEGSNYKEDEIGLFVSNLTIATGLPDTRRKLIEEGKFSTTGILFDVNAASIRPESAGVLKEIAGVLEANTGVKVKIIGHTDSDGADAANLELSKKRAEAVKAALAKDYGIDESAMQTDGKGEGVPVANNKTKEGKAQNRRVEFVKL